MIKPREPKVQVEHLNFSVLKEDLKAKRIMVPFKPKPETAKKMNRTPKLKS